MDDGSSDETRLTPLTIEASDVELALEPSLNQLSYLRSAIRRWLETSMLEEPARADVLSVANELAATACSVSAPGSPIEVRCRYTHSIAVVEVATFDAERAVEDEETLWSVDALGEQLVKRLASRVVVVSNGKGVVVRATITFDQPSPHV